MKYLNARFLLIPLLLLAVGFTVAACGDDDEEPVGEATADEATADEATADEATADEATADEATVDEASVDETYVRDVCLAERAYEAAALQALFASEEEGDGEVDLGALLLALRDLVDSLRDVSPPGDMADVHAGTIALIENVIALFDSLEDAEGSLEDAEGVFTLIGGLFEDAEEVPTPSPEALARLIEVANDVPECSGTTFLGETFLGEGEPEELRRVTFMLAWTPNTNYAGVYIAQAKGWYADNGLDVEIIEPGAGGVIQAVGAGAAHFGTTQQEDVIPARTQGIPVVSVATIIQHNTSSLIALGSEGIERPRDLAGKVYGGFGGAIEEPLISALVACDGGDPAAVEYGFVGNVDYLVGMQEDHYDFVWIFDGWDGIRYTDLLGEDISFIRFIDYTECIPDWYTPLIVTSETLIAEDPELVGIFMEATARGYRLAIENPSEAADILLAAAPELDEALVRASAEYLASRYVADPDDWGHQDLEVWVAFERFLREAGLTETAIDVEGAFTNDFLP